MQFKTNARCQGCSAAILKAMSDKFPNARWSMDLESADKILEGHGLPENAETAAQVEKTLAETGFKGSWIERGDNNL